MLFYKKKKKLPCFAELMSDLYCNIKMHADIMREIKVPDTIHTVRVAQNKAKHKLTLKYLSLRNEKFMTLSALDRFKFAFSSSISRSPLTFLKNTSLGGTRIKEFDDINNDSVYKFI